MSLHEISYSPEQWAMMERVTNMGGVVNVFIFNAGAPHTDEYTLCRHAAIAGMELIAARYERTFRQQESGLDFEQYRIRIFPFEYMTGEEISFADFIGNGYDPATQAVTLSVHETDSLEMSRNGGKGFAHALLDPPFGLSLPTTGEFGSAEYERTEKESMKKLLADYLNVVLGISNQQEATHLHIITWSDNRSNYFDPGKEWLGTNCWTVYNRRNQTVAFIAASATD